MGYYGEHRPASCTHSVYIREQSCGSKVLDDVVGFPRLLPSFLHTVSNQKVEVWKAWERGYFIRTYTWTLAFRAEVQPM